LFCERANRDLHLAASVFPTGSTVWKIQKIRAPPAAALSSQLPAGQFQYHSTEKKRKHKGSKAQGFKENKPSPHENRR
jgi:hypothetical protein